MSWWEILLAIIFTIPLAYLFVMGVILHPIIQNRQYKKDCIRWNKEHPNLQRRKCKTCKYAISETYFVGRYPNGIPRRHQTYCTLTKRKLNEYSTFCIISEPPNEYFYEPKDKKELYPDMATPIYYSAYGSCYHSTPHCRSIKNSQNIYTNRVYITDRYACPKCWTEKEGHLYPKN